MTRAEPYKYQNLDKNPVAALTVADSATQTTVQASGKILKLPPERYMDVVFKKLAHLRPKDDFHWAPPLSKIRMGDFMPLYLVPTRLQFADYGHHKSEVHADYIEKIL